MAAAAVTSLSPGSMEQLNSECFCISLDTAALRQALESEIGEPGLFDLIQQRCPYLFATRPVFLSHAHMTRMARVVQAIESVIALPAYREEVLASAPPIARHYPGGAKGVFFGYDFHVTEGAFGLIEINTNAGGAMLNAALARAHRACCAPMSLTADTYTQLNALEQTFFDMFKSEWHMQRGDAPLRTVAIVDDDPASQYLAPEFALCRQMFVQRGLQAVIADPKDLRWHDGRLWHQGSQGDTAIDLVYNRLTDFDLSEPAHQALHDAYLAGAAVVTPHPYAHALRANKRHLITLSNEALLESWGVSNADRQCLSSAIPATQAVSRDNADALWAQRRQLFFKPVAGYASKAAYRGDKLTKRVWEKILAGDWGDFIAQALVPPGQRLVNVDGVATNLKFDIRAYTYAGQIQLLAARTYTGQTTNFRTQGGGFSPVVVASPTNLPLYDDTNICSCIKSPAIC